MTLVRVILFIVILWEAFTVQRALIFSFVGTPHMEWPSQFPLAHHTFEESPKLAF